MLGQKQKGAFRPLQEEMTSFPRLGWVLCLIFLTLAFSGCVEKVDMVKVDINDLKNETYSLRKDVDALRAETDKLRQEEPARQEAFSAIILAQADILDQLSSAQKDVQEMRGNLEMQIHSNQKLLSEQSAEAAALKGRMDGLQGSLDAQQQKIARIEAALQKMEPPPKEVLQSPEEIYDAALNLFKEDKIAEARAAFAEFLKKHPSHDLSGNAQFWIGETYFKEKDFDQAILAYEEVLKLYPASRKVPAALLKQGIAFEEIKDAKVAEAIFRQLVEKYPDSEEAKTAKAKLAEIPPKKR